MLYILPTQRLLARAYGTLVHCRQVTRKQRTMLARALGRMRNRSLASAFERFSALTLVQIRLSEARRSYRCSQVSVSESFTPKSM